MADEEEDDGPVVELGEGPEVEGVPLSQVTSRLHFGIKRSDLLRREGETAVRTPEGPQALASILEESDETYFPTRQAFESAVREVVGTGPVPTE